ncbi:MAG: KTSC domain-containing protein [Betaproteobacteria bacterium]|jgi:hypothetical protein|nr:KTSC domain-containing protein [Betaproteobacteria bacterium]
MEMKRLSSGTLRAAGFDERNRVLQVEFSNGQILEYRGVSAEVARRLLSSSAAASYFRDNIEEEFTARRVK